MCAGVCPPCLLPQIARGVGEKELDPVLRGRLKVAPEAVLRSFRKSYPPDDLPPSWNRVNVAPKTVPVAPPVAPPAPARTRDDDDDDAPAGEQLCAATCQHYMWLPTKLVCVCVCVCVRVYVCACARALQMWPRPPTARVSEPLVSLPLLTPLVQVTASLKARSCPHINSMSQKCSSVCRPRVCPCVCLLSFFVLCRQATNTATNSCCLHRS